MLAAERSKAIDEFARPAGMLSLLQESKGSSQMHGHVALRNDEIGRWWILRGFLLGLRAAGAFAGRHGIVGLWLAVRG